MRRNERRNNLQICPSRDSNTDDSDLWSNTLPLDHGGALSDLDRSGAEILMQNHSISAENTLLDETLVIVYYGPPEYGIKTSEWLVASISGKKLKARCTLPANTMSGICP